MSMYRRVGLEFPVSAPNFKQMTYCEIQDEYDKSHVEVWHELYAIYKCHLYAGMSRDKCVDSTENDVKIDPISVRDL